MPFKKGQPRPENAGRKKGSTNRMTVALKDLIMGALADAGGQAYLSEQAAKNPTAFLSLVGRVLPLQVKEGGADPAMRTVVNHHYEP